MKNRFGINIIFAFIAFPIGLALIKDIDFENLSLKKPALDVLYIITFTFAMYFLFKKKQTKE